LASQVVVAGGTGLIGGALTASLEGDGHRVVLVSRGLGPGRVAWDDVGAAVDGAAAVVNLAGASIGGPRWTEARKRELRSSRVDTTRRLVEAISAAERKPAVFVTASGIDYYGDTGDALVDESSPPGSTFLARLCAEWEAAAGGVPVRHVAIRTALVIARGSVALRLLALPYRFFAGGPFGDGRQWFPWIQLDDLVSVYRRALADDGLTGPVNAVAPQQLRQREAARELGAVLHRPAAVPAPAAVLRLALGEQADLLLHGQRAVSTKLEPGAFAYPELRPALEAALGPASSVQSG
jgi:uncharacterized protein (TIGR01777 family)